MQCPSCSAKLPESSSFCEQCGAALPRPCPACGHANSAKAKFCSKCGARLTFGLLPPAGPTVARSASQTLPTPTASSAERRQLTIMFCDMVGSSTLSTRLDPEEQREVVGAFQSCCATEIKRLRGMVAQYLGDGVLAYFGYPAAHEDDAERAVRSGLAILDVVGALKPAAGVTLQARIGVASGVVVVGDLVREGVTQENAAIGETTNLAARLQSLAEPNTLAISPDTHRLVGALFEYRDLGQQALKGFAEPVHVRQVLRASKFENRFEARQQTASPLLGREEEIDLLVRRWQQVKNGEGRVVLITGEPGIGKSRLTRALLERLQAEPHTQLQYHCSPYHQDSALHPIISQLMRAAGIEQEDAADRKLDKLEAVLEPTAKDHKETVALLAPLLSIPLGPECVPLDLSPHRRKELTFRSLRCQLEALAARQPVLIVLEDAHWIDPTSLEFFSQTIEGIANRPVLLVVTARPEFTPPWPGHSYISTLMLNRLGRHEGEALILSITQGRALPAEVLSQIIAHTDGVPLFVEELTKTVIESGLLDNAGGRYVLRGPLPALAIPSTLHASLLARLDRLAAVKDVAQTAAAIGREFPYALIAAVAGLQERDLQAALGQLVAAELVFQRGLPPDAKYLFKHALVQDAAYASLVRSRRQQIHAGIARALEERFPDIVASEPEMLAHHFTAAGLTEQGVLYWQRAGQQASDRSAYLEATRHFNTGIELLKTLPDTPARTQQELALYIALGAAMIVIKGHASAEVEHAYQKARELCQRMGDAPELVPVLFGLWRFSVTRGHLRTARELGQTLLRLAHKADDPALAVIAHYAAGFSRYQFGEFSEARQHLEEGIAKYMPAQRCTAVFRIAQDPGVACRCYLALTLWFLGFPDQALARARDGLALALELKHPFSVGYARCWLAWVSQFRRDTMTVREQAEAALTLAVEQGFTLWAAKATISRGWALAIEHKSEEGVLELQKGIAAWRTTGAGATLTHYCCMHGEALGLVGNLEEAFRELDEAQAAIERTDEHWWEAEIYRLRGSLLLQQSMSLQGEAEAWFRRALDVAACLQAKSLELRAATSLGRLLRDQGKTTEARDLLAPVYGQFTEGFDTPDLKEAKALLEHL